MQTENLVAINEFCVHHNVEISFVQSLTSSGLIETIVKEETVYVTTEQLPQLEKMTRLYYDMDINVEGIEAITFLLERMHRLNTELAQIKSRLGFYEQL